MNDEVLYHGTRASNILSMINSGVIRPGDDHKIYFGRFEWEPVLFHGADGDAGASFAVKVSVSIPDGLEQRREPTPGVRSSLIIVTNVPLKVRVLELYVRDIQAGRVDRVLGEIAIRSYLEGRLATAR